MSYGLKSIAKAEFLVLGMTNILFLLSSWFWGRRTYYFCRRQNQELSPRYILKTVRHGGGNVIVWGSFSWCGVGPLHRIQGTIDQHMHKEILENVMLPYAEENLPLVWKFQQDNDPKHTAKSVKVWFNAEKINVFEWSAQSPDLNR